MVKYDLNVFVFIQCYRKRKPQKITGNTKKTQKKKTRRKKKNAKKTRKKDPDRNQNKIHEKTRRNHNIQKCAQKPQMSHEPDAKKTLKHAKENAEKTYQNPEKCNIEAT